MMKGSAKHNCDDLRPEYDLSELKGEFAASIINKW
jgi:hypothetical protein